MCGLLNSSPVPSGGQEKGGGAGKGGNGQGKVHRQTGASQPLQGAGPAEKSAVDEEDHGTVPQQG